MPPEHLTVGVIIERRKLTNPWVDAVWLPAAILPGPPDASPWTQLGEDGAATRYYAGPYAMELHSVDTANYRDNLMSGSPKIWVALREGVSDGEPVSVIGVTADPAEGEAFTEAGSDIVEALPMPAEIASRVASFVAEHHVERAFYKRKRDRIDPEALARREGSTPRTMVEGDDE
jgi:hypothetical protein